MKIKILIVGNNKKGDFAPFVIEQANALRAAGAEVCMFGVEGKGITGYLRCLPALKQAIKDVQPDIIHAHYGLSGLLANLQRKVPVVTTYHGSDINNARVRLFSKLSIWLSSWNIFVSDRTMNIVHPCKKYSLIPCGINLTDLQLTDRHAARLRMNLMPNATYILFAGAFDNHIKNPELAFKAVGMMKNAELLELKGYSRDEVTLLMCAADALLMTSFTEGSPQVIKEAMACGCKIVSVDVGDVAERIEGIEGCYVTKSREANDLALLLQEAIKYPERTKGRERIVADKLENSQVAEKLLQCYAQVLS